MQKPPFARAAYSGRSVAGAAEIHYGPGEDLETIDFALLREAAQQIDMAAYWLTDRAVIEALRQAAPRAV
jgi:phosphatidylserine/phosphatidylglycerophosphate/cardiolipin synthase-like enzyme